MSAQRSLFSDEAMQPDDDQRVDGLTRSAADPREAGATVQDPACGSGSFLVSAVEQLWAAAWVDANGRMAVHTRADGRLTARLTVTAQRVETLTRLRAALGEGQIRPASGPGRRARLQIEGRGSVHRAVLRVHEHLTDQRASADEMLAVCHPIDRRCALAGCDRRSVARHLCSMHYARAKRAGLLKTDAAQLCPSPVPAQDNRREPCRLCGERLTTDEQENRCTRRREARPG